MDLNLSEEQMMLREAARDFLVNECPKTLVRQMIEDDKGYTPDLWRKIANLGWLGLVLPEKYGGSNCSFLDLAFLLEETGRALLPGPLFSTVMLGALPIMNWGNDDQKSRFLPEIARGNLIVTMALTDKNSNYEPSAVKSKAVSGGDGFILSGTKLFVPDANAADWILYVARTGGRGEKGLTVFLVDAKSQGVTTRSLKTMSGEKQGEVSLSRVRVPRDGVLGKVDEGWQVIRKTLEQATVAKCAEMLGSAQQMLEMTVAYAKERRQFGQPIGSFQAIQHHCAEMAICVDGLRLVTYQAAWMLSQSLPCTKEVGIAKAWASEASKRVALLGLKIHGGVGFMQDHDMSLYFKKAEMTEFAFGDANFHREQVARELITA